MNKYEVEALVLVTDLFYIEADSEEEAKMLAEAKPGTHQVLKVVEIDEHQDDGYL